MERQNVVREVENITVKSQGNIREKGQFSKAACVLPGNK